MLAFGVFFDLLPIILVLVVIFFVISQVGGGIVEEAASYAEAGQQIEEGGVWNTVHGYVWKVVAGSRVLVQVGWKALVGGTAALFFGPFLYIIGSFIASTLAYFFFTFWFFMKGVNIWTFGSAQRVLVNVTSIIVEHIPGLDLLPGITFMVWRHVVISRAEDALKDSELLNKTTQQLNILNKVHV